MTIWTRCLENVSLYLLWSIWFIINRSEALINHLSSKLIKQANIRSCIHTYAHIWIHTYNHIERHIFFYKYPMMYTVILLKYTHINLFIYMYTDRYKYGNIYNYACKNTGIILLISFFACIFFRCISIYLSIYLYNDRCRCLWYSANMHTHTQL